MNNATIVLNESIRLMNEGTIGTTGNMITLQKMDGTTETIPEPETIHTFQTWKSLGYKVKKGEKAIARFAVWKYRPHQSEMEVNTESGETQTVVVDESKMFLKTACWFSASQVELQTAV